MYTADVSRLPTETPLDVAPGPAPRTVQMSDRRVCPVPSGWELLAPGDAALTRRVKQAGPSWTVKEKRGRKVFSLGVWAPADTICRVRDELIRERETPQYAARLAASRKRSAREQTEYAGEFARAVYAYLGFATEHDRLARELATAIARRAVPVGSGTVARTRRLPIEQRAEAATIAWLRHQTTAYDDMKIPRVKGMRREVRRLLAERSRRVLDRYRRGESIDLAHCPMRRALEQCRAEEDAT